ncbi:MAG: 3-dehydroquinate synthase, partial [Gemmatimonadetes bacterium]|nr:3-dehydroquinate synthase [Gemmatimonadota bacterium]
AGGDYPVLIEAGARRRLPRLLAAHAPAHRYALVADSNVAPLYAEDAVQACRAAGVACDLFVFPAGERHKTREWWATLTDRLREAGLGRDAAVVALGGGVTGDLAGFVAATYLRGVPLVQMPTSVLAMVDASVGRKTGADLPAGKNLVGAFHPPRLVIVDPETLETLPLAERREGLAEAVKHGAIADAAYLSRLETDAAALLAGEVTAMGAAVLRSVEIKASIVSADEREGGLRQVLNFGHTLGHALEAASSYRLGHGSAVAAGMILEARIGERMGITTPGTSERIARALGVLGLGSIPRAASVSAVTGFLGADKKARGGEARFVLLSRLGEVARRGEAWSHPIPLDLVGGILAESAVEA